MLLPGRLLRPARLYSLVRYLLLVVAFPCVYLGGVGAAFYYLHRAANASPSRAKLFAAASPTASTRLLVFAPHCDDETLGCAGVMHRTIVRGGAVEAVMVTNGDGFQTAVERQSRTLRVGPADYIQFAALRQQESYSALAGLGLSKDHVLFLGYPDRGLMPLWNSFWAPSQPYRSGYTRCSRSPYANTFDAAAQYCGRDLLEDIKRVIRDFRPTEVLVTHPSDDHPDHAAASAFVTRAVQEVVADPQCASWAPRMHLRYYLIHRGDWPTPQGEHLSDALSPPVEMSSLDTRWSDLALTPAETSRKLSSIDLYPSQTALMRRFLVSFARRDEIFGDVGPSALPIVPDGTMHVDANPADWESLPPALMDPVRDSMLRDLQGSGDIRAVYACRDSHTLYLRIDTRLPVSRRVAYTVRLRAFGPHGDTASPALVRRIRGASADPSVIRHAFKGRILEASIGWDRVTNDLPAAATIAIGVETSLAGVELDKTGIRFLTL